MSEHVDGIERPKIDPLMYNIMYKTLASLIFRKRLDS